MKTLILVDGDRLSYKEQEIIINTRYKLADVECIITDEKEARYIREFTLKKRKGKEIFRPKIVLVNLGINDGRYKIQYVIAKVARACVDMNVIVVTKELSMTDTLSALIRLKAIKVRISKEIPGRDGVE